MPFNQVISVGFLEGRPKEPKYPTDVGSGMSDAFHYFRAHAVRALCKARAMPVGRMRHLQVVVGRIYHLLTKEPVHLLGSQARHRQHLKDARDLLTQLLEARMRARPMQLCDDVGDSLPHSGNLGEAILLDQHVERDRKRRKTIRSAGVGLCTIWIAAAQCGPLRIFP
ncbi:hypothetical protein LMTR13_08610 [Bradyrhizobium icense]|uniref:Uncharacterized protein n=1 Tax=Bradyrhizobium icense TaxID=1274631 RepID=A0A1B1UBS4_9BRAD|nr:hypothetical protein LMTR13_08610 [Bradyrhizobium icense]